LYAMIYVEMLLNNELQKTESNIDAGSSEHQHVEKAGKDHASAREWSRKCRRRCDVTGG